MSNTRKLKQMRKRRLAQHRAAVREREAGVQVAKIWSPPVAYPSYPSWKHQPDAAIEPWRGDVQGIGIGVRFCTAQDFIDEADEKFQAEEDAKALAEAHEKERAALLAFAGRKYLSPSELAEYLECSRSTVDRETKAGRIPGRFLFGGQVRYVKVIIDDWLAEQGIRKGGPHGTLSA